MTIQAIGNYYPIPSSVRTDFQNMGQSLGNLVDAIKSGNQDQVTLSGNTFLQAMNQYQTDLTNAQQTNSNNPNSTQDDFRNLIRAVTSAAGVIQSGSQDQITTSQNNLQQAETQFQTDLANIQPIGSSSQNQNSIQTDYQNLQSAISSLLEAQKSGDQDKINAANDAMQKAVAQLQTDVPGLEQVHGHHHHHHHQNVNANSENTNVANDSTNNKILFALLAAGYGNNGQAQGNTKGVNNVNTTA